MAINSTPVVIGTTPVLVAYAGDRLDSDRLFWVEIYNDAAHQIYIGNSNVTTTTGRIIASGASWSAPLTQGDAIYGVTDTGSHQVHVLFNRS